MLLSGDSFKFLQISLRYLRKKFRQTTCNTHFLKCLTDQHSAHLRSISYFQCEVEKILQYVHSQPIRYLLTSELPSRGYDFKEWQGEFTDPIPWSNSSLDHFVGPNDINHSVSFYTFYTPAVRLAADGWLFFQCSSLLIGSCPCQTQGTSWSFHFTAGHFPEHAKSAFEK